MNFDNWNPEFLPMLNARTAEFEKLGANELAKRITIALMIQDSCNACWIETVEHTLIEGKPGYWTCEACTKEMS